MAHAQWTQTGPGASGQEKIVFLMMIKFILSFCLISLPFSSYTQSKNNIWCFGDSAGINFNSTATPITTSMDGRGNCVSIADGNGNLLFYAAENNVLLTKIYNANNDTMDNSSWIHGDGYYAGKVILPKPNSDSLYYLFYRGNPNNVDTFYYALIDMSQNNGLGSVIEKNKVILPIRFADCMTAVQHGNGQDWWVIAKYYTYPFTNYNRFFCFHVTKDTIMPPIVQDFNDMDDGGFQKIIWHPNYNKFMLISVVGYMAEYNFDRCTGTITLNRSIFPEQQSNYNRIFFDGAYSPNGNVFYVSRNTYANLAGNYNYLLQYDLTAFDIPASCDTLDSTSHPPLDCGAVRLAPDGKIYYTHAYGYTFLSYPYPDSLRNMYNENLGVVNFPDSIGKACNFQPFSFYLGGKRTYWGLPNNPNYELGPLVGSPCDTLGLNTPKPPLGGLNAGLLQCTYVSSWSKVFINASGVKGKDVTVTIYDNAGLMVSKFVSLSVNSGYVTLDVDCNGWSEGMYIVNLQSEKESLSCKFVKQ